MHNLGIETTQFFKKFVMLISIIILIDQQLKRVCVSVYVCVCVCYTPLPEIPGHRLNVKTVFPRYGDSFVKDKKIRRSREGHIFNMDIPILVRRYLYIETPPASGTKILLYLRAVNEKHDKIPQ